MKKSCQERSSPVVCSCLINNHSQGANAILSEEVELGRFETGRARYLTEMNGARTKQLHGKQGEVLDWQPCLLLMIDNSVDVSVQAGR